MTHDFSIVQLMLDASWVVQAVVLLLIVFVQAMQSLGDWLVRRLRH